jgi:outer membrane protein assembly factor BamB
MFNRGKVGVICPLDIVSPHELANHCFSGEFWQIHPMATESNNLQSNFMKILFEQSQWFTCLWTMLLCLPAPLIALAQSSLESTSQLPASTEIDQANTGAIARIGFAEPPNILWQQGDGDSWWGGMAVHDGVVVAIERNRKAIMAFNAVTGERLWEHQAGKFDYGMGIIMTCDPDFDAVILGGDLGISAWNRKSGEKLWEHLTDTGVDAPTIAAGLVIAGGSDGNVHAVDLKTGAAKWKHDFMADAPEDPEGFDGRRARFEGRPARPQEASTDGETVFLSIFDQCRTLAIDVQTGKRRWTFQSKGWMGSRPTVSADAVYVGSQDRHFYAIDKQTGQELWNIETGSWNSASPAITEKYVVFGSNDGKVYAVLRGMGSTVWEYDTTDGGKTRGSIYCRPLVSEGVVYLPTMAGTLHAIDLETGKQKWRLTPSAGAQISSQLHFDQGRMYLFTRKGDGKDGQPRGEAAIYAIGEDNSNERNR